jgi:2'-5' RNA ligase
LLTERCTGLGEFGIVLRGIGVFKNFRDPRIIWAGTEPSESLFRLNDVIVSGLKYKGINTEERSFNPHLTLGRIKMIRPQKNLKLILDKYMDLEIQKVSVSEVILYESILTTQGPLYRPIRIINLT